MKANESLPNYDSKVRESTNFIIKSIKTVCKDTPERRAGTDEEAKAQQYFEQTVSPFADSVQTQEFTSKVVSAKRTMLNGVFLLLTVILAALCAIVIFLVPSDLAKYLMFIPLVTIAFTPRMAVKINSKNIIAVKKPSGSVERRIIFAGDINSPVERHLLRIGSTTLESIVTLAFFISMFICIAYDGLYILVLGDKIHPLVTLFQLVFIPFGIGTMKYFNPKQVVQGANGNLTGTFDSAAVIQYLSYNNLSLENTEVVAVSCGAGYTGAKEFVKAYSPVYNDVPTVFVSVDCLQNTECFGTSGEAVSLVKDASKNADIPVAENKDAVGSSLARAAKKTSLKAVRISAVDEENHVYAAREDVPAALSPMAIEAGLKLSLETAYLFDEKGI